MKRTVGPCLVIAIVLVIAAGCATIEGLMPGGGPSASVVGGGGKNLSSVRVGNNETVELGAGTYSGDLLIDANNSELVGAGIGATTIRGNITIDGNSNRVIGITIIGTVTIFGNTNDLTESDVSRAEVTAEGNKNTY